MMIAERRGYAILVTCIAPRRLSCGEITLQGTPADFTRKYVTLVNSYGHLLCHTPGLKMALFRSIACFILELASA